MNGLGLGQNWGVVISEIDGDGPAYAAGIESGDIVMEVDGQRALCMPGFAARCFQHLHSKWK
jgi:S1-C subfamily serine protease